MSYDDNEPDVTLKGVLTNDGVRRANNLILDLLRPHHSGEGFKKQAVTFTLDQTTGDIIEIGTRKTCKVEWVKRNEF